MDLFLKVNYQNSIKFENVLKSKYTTGKVFCINQNFKINIVHKKI